VTARDLAEAVASRRVGLGLRQVDLEVRGGPSRGTVRNVEQGAREGYARRTFWQLDRALDWPDGTAQGVFEDNRAAPGRHDEAAQCQCRDLLLEIRELVVALSEETP
jgi:hypothetical protein